MKTILKIVAIILPTELSGLGGLVLVALFQISTLTFAGNGLEFIENRGQVMDMEGNLRPDILFIGDGGGAKIYLRQKGVSYVMTEIEGLDEEELEEAEEAGDMEKYDSLLANAILKGHRVDMEFVNANVDAKIRVEEPTQGYFNYYLGHCPEGITGVKAHRKVIYENMYPNIDVVFHGGIKEGMEYDFVVKPGGSVEDIILKYKGAEQLTIDNEQLSMEERKLKIKTTLGDIIEEIPEVYQIINGERVKIEAAYELQANHLDHSLQFETLLE